MLTQERLKELLHYDPETGVFIWLVGRGGGAKAGDVAGSFDAKGYIVIVIKGAIYRAHRLAWLYIYGEWPEYQVDHENREKKDNRIINLRAATNAENCRNQGKAKNNTSGITGVAWRENCGHWWAQIMVDGKSIYLGSFKDKFEAICARMSANNRYGFHSSHGR